MMMVGKWGLLRITKHKVYGDLFLLYRISLMLVSNTKFIRAHGSVFGALCGTAQNTSVPDTQCYSFVLLIRIPWKWTIMKL